MAIPGRPPTHIDSRPTVWSRSFRACRDPGVSGMSRAVATVEDVGAGASGLHAEIDDAYRMKYGRSGGTERMVTDEAAAATLRLSRDG
jgi:hypothetical protein